MFNSYGAQVGRIVLTMPKQLNGYSIQLFIVFFLYLFIDVPFSLSLSLNQVNNFFLPLNPFSLCHFFISLFRPFYLSRSLWVFNLNFSPSLFVILFVYFSLCHFTCLLSMIFDISFFLSVCYLICHLIFILFSHTFAMSISLSFYHTPLFCQSSYDSVLSLSLYLHHTYKQFLTFLPICTQSSHSQSLLRCPRLSSMYHFFII